MKPSRNSPNFPLAASLTLRIACSNCESARAASSRKAKPATVSVVLRRFRSNSRTPKDAWPSRSFQSSGVHPRPSDRSIHATVRKPPPRIKVSRVGQQHIVRRKEEMRQQSVGSALSSADPMQVTAKIVSLIDTARYRNWPRRLVLYIYAYALWADSLESSGACNGHVNRCTREASVYKSGQSRDELQRSVQPLSPSSQKAKPAAVSVVLPLEQSNATSIDARRFDSYRCVGSGRHGCPRGHRVEERHCCTKCFWRFPSAIAASRTRL